MTLTPEQFNKLVTKQEHEELKEDVLEIKKDVKQVLCSVDGIAKKFNDHKTEHVANIAAHDRFQGEINNIKEHVGMDKTSVST